MSSISLDPPSAGTRLESDAPQRQVAARTVAVASLLGMAYCHLEDVGMKFEEHVYYMAVLFCLNIAASLLLAVALAFGRHGRRRWRRLWAAALGLALLTIVGFVWSRTAGFPQMADHVGEWDTLGLTSVAFEAVIVAVSAGVPLRTRAVTATAALTIAILATTAVAAAAMTMRGDPSPYPHVDKATPAQRAAARRIWRATLANAWRFQATPRAQRLGYRFSGHEDKAIGWPALRHMRKTGKHSPKGLLDARAPQSLVYWCPQKGQCTLVAFMYRAHSGTKPPTYGPMLAWHAHSAHGGWMLHVWLTRTLRSAFARCAPWTALTANLGITELPWSPDVEADAACPADGGPMGM